VAAYGRSATACRQYLAYVLLLRRRREDENRALASAWQWRAARAARFTARRAYPARACRAAHAASKRTRQRGHRQHQAVSNTNQSVAEQRKRRLAKKAIFGQAHKWNRKGKSSKDGRRKIAHRCRGFSESAISNSVAHLACAGRAISRRCIAPSISAIWQTWLVWRQ